MNPNSSVGVVCTWSNHNMPSLQSFRYIFLLTIALWQRFAIASLMPFLVSALVKVRHRHVYKGRLPVLIIISVLRRRWTHSASQELLPNSFELRKYFAGAAGSNS